MKREDQPLQIVVTTHSVREWSARWKEWADPEELKAAALLSEDDEVPYHTQHLRLRLAAEKPKTFRIDWITTFDVESLDELSHDDPEVVFTQTMTRHELESMFAAFAALAIEYRKGTL